MDAVNNVVMGILPFFTAWVPMARVKTLVMAIWNKIPPLSKTDEANLFVRLPVLAAALQSSTSSEMEEILTVIDGNGNNCASLFLEGLTDYVLNEQHFSDARNSAACCIHALVKHGFNKNLDCPAKPLLKIAVDCILAFPSKVALVKNCLNFFALLVRNISGAGSLISFAACC
jgi:hypothetical protein